MKRSLLTLVCVFLVPFFLTSCVILESKANYQKGSAGQIYSLPKKLVTLRGLLDKHGTNSVEWVGEVVVPDAEAQFLLKYKSSILSEDDFTVTIEEGLIKQISLTAEDKTGETIVQLGKTAIEVVKSLDGAPFVKKESDKKAILWEHTFDPCAVPDYVKKSLGEQGFDFSCRRLSARDGKGDGKKDSQQSFGGVAYRPAEPYQIRISKGDEPFSSFSRVLLLPQKAPIMFLPLRRSAFVKSISTVKFEKGMLQSFALKKPSEALGFTKIPYELAQAIAKLPADLLTLRIKRTEDESKLLGKQAELLQAQIDLIKKQKQRANPLPEEADNSGKADGSGK